jgi:CelD/BcsL family acetyltransferase involved in cellulose biosynthesis
MVHTLQELASHAEGWNALSLKSPHQLPDLSYAWIASYLETQLAPKESWFCLLAYEEGNLVGILPVVVTPDQRWGFRCDRLRTPSNDQTASVDFLVAPGLEEKIIPLFLNHLNRLYPSWHCFEMRHLPETSLTGSIIKRKIKKVKALTVFDGFGCFVKIEGTFEIFKSRLRPNFRRKLGSSERKLLSLPQARISFQSGKFLSEQGLSRFMQIESLSWKGSQGSALCQNEALASFYRVLTDRLAELGWLEWAFLEVEGKTIAAILGIRVNRSLVALKICYDKAYASFSPGTVLLTKLFEKAFLGGQVDEINCLTDYPWFKNWPMEKRAYYNLTLFPWKPFSILTGYLPLLLRRQLGQVPALKRLSRFWGSVKESVLKRTRRITILFLGCYFSFQKVFQGFVGG